MTDANEVPPIPSVTNSTGLPPIKELFAQSWQALTKSLLSLFLLNIMALVAIIILALSAVILFFASGVGVGLSHSLSYEKVADLSKANLSLFASIGIVGFIYFVLFILLCSVIGTASVIIVANYRNPVPLGIAIKKGFGLIIPLFILNLILGFFTLGSFFVFIFPVLIISYFFMYAAYETVLSDKRRIGAIKSSIRIVGSHFGEIIVRLILYFLFYVLIVIFIPNIIRRIDPETGNILTGMSFILNYIIGWFGLSYGIVLYQQAKTVTDETKKVGLTWIWILTIAGYIILGLIVFGSSRLITQAWKSGYLKKLYEQRFVPKPPIGEEIVSYAPSACGLSIPIPKTTDNYQGKDRKWLYEELPLAGQAFDIVNSDVFPVKTVLAALVNYKDGPAKLVDGKYNLTYPGISVYCADNNRSLSLEEYKSMALANKTYKVTLDREVTWGEVKLIHVAVGGTYKNQSFKESSYLGVSSDSSRLLYIRTWAPGDNDPLTKIIDQDISLIIRNLKYREVKEKIENMRFADVTNVPSQTTNTTSNQPSCTQYNIREGEFASNKCYSQQDYNDLIYYLDRFNSAVFSYNGAVGQMSVTCNGSEFFKNQCDVNKQEKQQAENDMNKYRGIIQGIIAKGK